MNSLEATGRVIAALETLQIRYMLVGFRWTDQHGTSELLRQLNAEIPEINNTSESE